MSERPWERHCIECGLRCAEPCWRCAIRAAAEPDADEHDEFGTVPLRLDAGALVIDERGEIVTGHIAEALGFRVYIGHDRPDRRVSVPAIRAPRRPLGGAS